MNAINPSVPEANIQVYGLSKYYSKFRALDDVSLTIQDGEFLTLLGPSGSGKSTLLMAIAGFVEPSHGDIFHAGKSITRQPAEHRNFGVVLQGYALFPHMTVSQNIAYPLKIRGLSKSDIALKVKQSLELVQLTQFADRLPRELSGGQQQRVALARALVFSPKVLLLDEPMGALDKKLRHDLQLELRQLHRRLGCTFINVTHDQEEAMAMSDRIAIMRNGKIIQVDNPTRLYNRPKTRFVADFLGKSNFIKGKVVSVIDGVAQIDVEGSTPVFHTVDEPMAIGDQVTLALRPQQVKIGSGINSRAMKIESVIFLGTHVELTLRWRANELFNATDVLARDASLWREGDMIEVSWQPNDSICIQDD